MRYFPFFLGVLFAIVGCRKSQDEKLNAFLAAFRDGEAHLERKDFDAAIAAFTKAIELNPSIDETFIRRADAWVGKKQLDRALDDLTVAIRLEGPNKASALTSRGRLWCGCREFDKGIADLDDAIRLKPESARAFEGRAMAWESLNENDKAIADYTEAIRLEPRARRYSGRGECLARKGEFEKALVDHNEAIRLEPTAWHYRGRASVWERKKDYPKAVTDYDKAIRLDPQDGRVMLLVAKLLTVCQDPSIRDGKRALELSRKALELGGEEPYCFTFIAAANAQIGDFEEAVVWQEKLLQLALPEKAQAVARTNLTRYQNKQTIRLLD